MSSGLILKCAMYTMSQLAERYDMILEKMLISPVPLVVKADAGSGKTTLVKRICHDWATSKGFSNFDLVLLAPFRALPALDKRVTTSLQAALIFLSKALQNIPSSQKMEKTISDLCMKNKLSVLIVLDGFDESRTIWSELKHVLDATEHGDGLSALPYNLLITSRAYATLDRCKQCHIAKICPFSEEQQNDFINKMVGRLTKDRRFSIQNTAESVRDTIKRSTHLQSVAGTPLLLTFLCLIKNLSQITSLTQLYDTIVRSMLTLFSQTRTSVIKQRINVPRYKQNSEIFKLAHLACSGFFEKSGDSISFRKNPDILFDREKVAAALDVDFFSNFGLLVSDEYFSGVSGSSCVSFPHRSFQEYFCALYFMDLIETNSKDNNIDSYQLPDVLMKRQALPVVTFLVGLVSDQESVYSTSAATNYLINFLKKSRALEICDRRPSFTNNKFSCVICSTLPNNGESRSQGNFPVQTHTSSLADPQKKTQVYQNESESQAVDTFTSTRQLLAPTIFQKFRNMFRRNHTPVRKPSTSLASFSPPEGVHTVDLHAEFEDACFCKSLSKIWKECATNIELQQWIESSGHVNCEEKHVYDNKRKLVPVYCVQFDEKKIIAGCEDATIRIWHKKSLRCINELKRHTGRVWCLQFDEKVIISGSLDNTVRVWDVDTGETLNVLKHHSNTVSSLCFHDSILVTGSFDNTVAVWNIKSPQDITLRQVLTGHTGLRAVDFDMRHIVSGSDDKTVKVWSLHNGDLLRTMEGHESTVLCLQLRDNLVVSGSWDRKIRLWNVETGECLRVLKGHQSPVYSIQCDSERIVSGDDEGKIKVWDLQSAMDPSSLPEEMCLTTISEHNDSNRVRGIQFDERQMVSCSLGGSIVIYDFK